MKRAIGVALAVAILASGHAQAQYGYAPPPAYAVPPPDAPPPPEAMQPAYAPPQLDQMLASIALYPDPLLTAILTAATYPQEIADADRWVSYGPNAALNDGALESALQGIGWDPSVKSLVPFPQILHMLNAHLDWTEALGNAFLAQQPAVMDSIQRLRHEAMAAGTLVSNNQQRVLMDGPYIRIEPQSPQFVYVPIYNPAAVYGPWPYPAYAPIYYGPPPGLFYQAVPAGIAFGAGIVVVDRFWRWGHWDWRAHRIDLDRDRFNRINAGRPPVAATVWHHDSARRPPFAASLEIQRQRSRQAPQPFHPAVPLSRSSTLPTANQVLPDGPGHVGPPGAVSREERHVRHFEPHPGFPTQRPAQRPAQTVTPGASPPQPAARAEQRFGHAPAFPAHTLQPTPQRMPAQALHRPPRPTPPAMAQVPTPTPPAARAGHAPLPHPTAQRHEPPAVHADRRSRDEEAHN